MRYIYISDTHYIKGIFRNLQIVAGGRFLLEYLRDNRQLISFPILDMIFKKYFKADNFFKFKSTLFPPCKIDLKNNKDFICYKV